MARITPENARILALKSAEVRRQARDERAERIRQALSTDPQTATSAEPFLAQVIAQTRKAIELVMVRILEEVSNPSADGQRLSWLATASDKLHTQWHNLSGNPKPAPLKMTSRQSRSYQQPSTSPPPTATD